VKLVQAVATIPVDLPAPDALAAAAEPRIAIEAISPSVNGGRFAAKRLVGDIVEVAADLIADGHDRLAAALLWRAADEPDWREAPMRPLGNDRWAGRFPLSRLGRHLFTVLAWKDRFGNFAEELEKKHAAGQPIELELEEGRLLVGEAAAQTANSDAAPRLAALAASLSSAGPDERRRLLLAPATAEWMAAARIRPHASDTRSSCPSTPSGAPPGLPAGMSCSRARRAAIRPWPAPSMT
jgi:starch synthase (maltosyl-transferring)